MSAAVLPPLIAPFAAERYRAVDRLGDLVAPPYDVISMTFRDTLAARHPHNIVRLILPSGPGNRYDAAAKLLAQWRAEGVLERDPAPGVYVVQQEFLTPDGRTHLRTGVIAGLHVEPYDAGRVRPHEHTHRGPKEDRLALARATGAMLETIFVLARDERGHLQRRLDGVTHHEPLAVAELDGVAIGLWRVGGVQGREIAHAVGDGPLYIADGHHRFETANALRAELPVAERMPALVVPLRDPGLFVLPTHRLVTGTPIDPVALVTAWARHFAVDEREAELDPRGLLEGLGAGASAVVVLPQGRVLALSAPSPQDGELEIAVVERDVVQPLLAAAGPAGALSYTAHPGEVFDAVGRGSAAAGVLVRPTPVERVLAVADARGVMPPKSTYFAPKVPSGLVFLPYV
ncbi:MAG: DUF1015 domain-containing protein [Gemmatimonadota bacterium]|nr:DUF1015 domain-containing protein [Gemmatimonadota bacterium]